MNKLFLFFWAILVLILPSKTLACGGEAPEWYDADLFRIVPSYSVNDAAYRNTSLNETVDFWYNYLGKKVKRDDILLFFREGTSKDLSNEGASAYPFVKAVMTQSFALQYLRACMLLEEDTRVEWGYRTRCSECLTTCTQWTKTAQNVPEAFHYRMVFLKMRLAANAKNYDEILTLWNTQAQSCPNAALLARMNGYAAHAFFEKGEVRKAMQIYAELGDRFSLDVCISSFVGEKGIRALYDSRTDANDKTWYYALQDYCNYCWESRYSYYEGEMEIDKETKKDMERVRQLCQSHHGDAEGAVWMSATAWLYLCESNYGEAYELAYRVHETSSDAVVKQNAFRMMCFASICNAPMKADNATLTRIANDYVKLMELANKELPIDHNQPNMHKPIADLCPNLCFVEAAYKDKLTKYLDSQKLFAAHALVDNLSEQLTRNTWFDLSDAEFIPSEMEGFVDATMSSEEAEAFMEMVTKKKANDVFSQAIIKRTKVDMMRLTDIVGTKLMRDGKYGKALGYLEKLTPKYLKTRPYQAYLANREMKWNKPFFRTQYQEDWDNEVSYGENYKLNFCRDMVQRINALPTLSGNELAKAEYEMAMLMFQASNKGDLFALSEFYMSICDEPNKFCDQALVQLRNALKHVTAESLRHKIYYGIASMPTSQNGLFWDLKYDWHDDQFHYAFNLFHPSRDAFEYLARHRTEDPVTANCDVIKRYAAIK
ncbi:MAG: hypothetical protein KBT12_08135 [Bacteroidales bacterium]|nr:hypothetical protein [Candidatus Physcousia equi]